jgi:hypothetical protein
MRFSALLLAAACLSAQVRFDPADKTISIDGKPFTTFHAGSEVGKPFLAPVRSASGKVVTRGFPMENLPGESRDHLHHTGLWFSYDDVNGFKLWENHPSYTKPHMGKIVLRDSAWKQSGASGSLAATMEWRDTDGNLLLTENRTMKFAPDPAVRTIDFTITLTAAQDITFGDTKEGAFAIRLIEAFTERKGCKIVDADGRTAMANVWGKRSNWVDYSAEIEGERLGVAMFDHPSNPRHPTYWHARDYGLFSLNPFGRAAFDDKQEESQWKLAKGDILVFRWLVAIHPGDASTGHVAELYKAYADR